LNPTIQATVSFINHVSVYFTVGVTGRLSLCLECVNRHCKKNGQEPSI